MEIGKNVPLVAGILIPVAMIIFVALSVYVPQWLANPEYDFLYAVNSDYQYKYNYEVTSQGKLTRALVRDGEYYRNIPEDQLYVFNVDEEEGEPISFGEASQLTLDGSSKSPDGYELVMGGGSDGGFFPFFYSSGSYGKHFLKSKSASMEINLSKGDGSYYSRVQFVGWIK